ncbi:hypothetical protein Tco_0916467, partial [Tanacetum coccineum]
VVFSCDGENIIDAFYLQGIDLFEMEQIFVLRWGHVVFSCDGENIIDAFYLQGIDLFEMEQIFVLRWGREICEIGLGIMCEKN